MDNNVGIKVSASGVDAKTATDSQLLLNMKYPFHKLDITNTVSFQNIFLSFTKDVANPPNPGNPLGGPTIAYKSTNVYQFAHGYTYIPSIWIMDLNDYEAPDTTTFPTYQNGNLILLGFVSGSNGGYTQVALWVYADATNVYLDAIKEVKSDNSGNYPSPTVDLTGFTAKLRIYVFAEDLATS